jgi:hypothetical protein
VEIALFCAVLHVIFTKLVLTFSAMLGHDIYIVRVGREMLFLNYRLLLTMATLFPFSY